MIEYYTLKHKGGQANYNEAVVPVASPELSIAIAATEKLGDTAAVAAKIIKDIMSSELVSRKVPDLASEIDRLTPDNTEYMVFKINDDRIDSMRRGGVYGKIVKNGELKVLPNGILGLEDEDRIVCGTEEFFSFLADEEILADSLFAESCQEWMNYMVKRISDINWLSGKNLSAVTLIVRSSE